MHGFDSGGEGDEHSKNYPYMALANWNAFQPIHSISQRGVTFLLSRRGGVGVFLYYYANGGRLANSWTAHLLVVTLNNNYIVLPPWTLSMHDNWAWAVVIAYPVCVVNYGSECELQKLGYELYLVMLDHIIIICENGGWIRCIWSFMDVSSHHVKWANWRLLKMIPIMDLMKLLNSRSIKQKVVSQTMVTPYLLISHHCRLPYSQLFIISVATQKLKTKPSHCGSGFHSGVWGGGGL